MIVIIPDAAEAAMKKIIDRAIAAGSGIEEDRAEMRQVLVNHLWEHGNFWGVSLEPTKQGDG